MYRYYQRCHDQAEAKFKKCDDARQAAVNEKEKLKGTVKTMENQLVALNTKLTNQESMQRRITSLEQELKAEKEAKERLEGSLKKAEEEKPGIRRRAVNRFLQSDNYRNLLVDRYTGGWVAAHRCVCKAENWDAEKWQAAEAAYGEDMHLSPTSYEGDYFDNPPPIEVLKNLEPRDLPEEEFADALIASPVKEDNAVGTYEPVPEKEPGSKKD